MRGGLAVAGAGVLAVICCAAVPLTVGITGLGTLAAFGASVGTLALVALSMMILSIVWTRRRGSGER